MLHLSEIGHSKFWVDNISGGTLLRQSQKVSQWQFFTQPICAAYPTDWLCIVHLPYYRAFNLIITVLVIWICICDYIR